MMTDLNLDPAEAERRAERKKLHKKKREHKGPRLTLLSVSGTVVECQLETGKQKTVTFKFDCEDLVPSDVAKNLVAENLLSDSNFPVFVEMVEDIMHQVREKPGRMPVVRNPLGQTSAPEGGVEGDGAGLKVCTVLSAQYS